MELVRLPIVTDVVAIGECMIELTGSFGGAARIGFAGDSFNTALYLARLGEGVAYLTALGTDPFSTEMQAEWEREGLATHLVLRDPDRLPGLYAVRTDAAGERSFYYWREASAARRLFTLPGIDAALVAAAGAQLLYVSGITLSLFPAAERDRLGGLAASVRAAGGDVAFDPNYRPRGWASPAEARAAFATFADHVSIALPTFDDEAALHGDISPSATLVRWQALGAREVIVKQGADGCLTAQGPVPARTGVIAIDTTGAGDAFNAGYLAARRRGHDGVAAAAFGTALAGEIVRHRGAIMPRSAMPSLPDARSASGA